MGKGAGRGPQAIFDASADMELFDVETGSEVFRQGILRTPPVSERSPPVAMVAAVRKCAGGDLEKDVVE